MSAAAAAAAGLTRAALRERTLLTLQGGGGSGPDVVLVETAGGGRAVVKDYAASRPWLRWTAARWLLRREARVYRALDGHPAVPRFLGFVDRWAFAVEHRPGPHISRRRPWTFSPAFQRDLEAAVRELHARGVVHLDLSHRSNVRATPDGRPVIVDFGAALRFRPGGLAARWLLPLCAAADRRALRKWRERLDPAS